MRARHREGVAAHGPSAAAPLRPGEDGGTTRTAALMSLRHERRAGDAFLTDLLRHSMVERAAPMRRKRRVGAAAYEVSSEMCGFQSQA